MITLVAVGHLTAFVSDEDTDLVSGLRWNLVPRRSKGGGAYAATWKGGKTVYMHRLIMGAAPGVQVDHIDGDGLNNTRDNLRLCDQSLNNVNRHHYKPASGFRGVYPQPGGKSWQVKIYVRRRLIRGGTFRNIEDAARKYDELAREHFGQFATLNFKDN